MYQRGPTSYWCRYHYRGRQYREPGGTTRAAAVRLLKKRLGEMGQGKAPGIDVEKTVFSDLKTMLLDDYTLSERRSKPRAELALKRLDETFGRSRALDITSDRLAAYALARQAVAARATVRMELTVLKRAFRLALRADKVATIPAFPTIHVDNARQGFFEEEEFLAVAAHLPDHVRSLSEFLYWTGWRKGEALALEWRSVDFKTGVIRIETTKNGEPRTLPFRALPELAALLKRQRGMTDAVEREQGVVVRPVFHHRGGEPIRDFRGAWESACRAAGVVGKLVHDFRRTAVRRMERAGVSRSVAMKVTGHKTEAVYKRYAIVSENDIAEGLAKVARFREDQAIPEAAVVAFQRAKQ